MSLHDLQRLIAGQRPVSGRVVAVTGGRIRVATAQGVVEVTGAGLDVGNLVVVQNGMAVRTVRQKPAPIHFV